MAKAFLNEFALHYVNFLACYLQFHHFYFPLLKNMNFSTLKGTDHNSF